MKKTSIYFVLGLSLFLSACATQTVYLKDHAFSKLRYEENVSSFIVNIEQEKVINAVEICKGEENISKIESQFTASNVLIRFVTLGIYTPRVVRIYCLQ